MALSIDIEVVCNTSASTTSEEYFSPGPEARLESTGPFPALSVNL